MASKYGGYMGRVLKIDLTCRKASEYPWSDRDRELYMGGKIMAAKILSDHFTGQETPFSEENWIVAATGPLTGTGAPSSSRFDLSTLLPSDGDSCLVQLRGQFWLAPEKGGIRRADPHRAGFGAGMD